VEVLEIEEEEEAEEAHVVVAVEEEVVVEVAWVGARCCLSCVWVYCHFSCTTWCHEPISTCMKTPHRCG
jgi:hypothetical protein